MTRLRIVHRTGYAYANRVSMSYNEARMTPLTDQNQVVLESYLEIKPTHAVVGNYRDYWGTRVTTFDMQFPHEMLDVSATTTVEVFRSDPVISEEALLDWDELHSPGITNDFADWLPQTRLSSTGDEVQEKAREVVADKNPYEAARAVFDWLRDEMEYVQGVTGVHSNAEEAWLERKGVCQDLAHLAIGVLRGLGIPAQYVSGYLHPRPSAGIGETVQGESHAWIEWYDGEWRGWDPTNGSPVGDFHVSVARGRDYRDVPPLKGILSGGVGSEPHVSVEITRLA
ncbi:transglutaminase family protein [Arthrobacter monumenti]